jgi:hypothetical protein
MWKQAFDSFEKTVGPELENLVRQAQFQDAYANWIKVQHRMREQVIGALHQWWKLWGLSTTDDVARLSAQVASLEQAIRDLRERAQARADRDDVGPERSDGAPAP